MKISLGLDVGNCFTSMAAAGENGITWAKVESVPGNPAASFYTCFLELARKLDTSPQDLRSRIASVRCASSITDDFRALGDGTDLGLIVGRGSEGMFDSNGGEQAGSRQDLSGFISREMVVGVKGRVDEAGRIVEPIDEGELKLALERLVDSGARSIVVSLPNSHLNDCQERQVYKIVEREYPPHFYLGSPDLFLGSEMSSVAEDRTRTSTALLNAFLRPTTRGILRIEESLRDLGYSQPLLAARSDGEVGAIRRTSSLDMYNSSATAGLLGCAAYAEHQYGIRDLVCLEVGAVGARAGVIRRGMASISVLPKVDGIRVDNPMIEMASIGAGSLASARVRSHGDTIEVGLERVMHGPPTTAGLPDASVPTVLDAELVLGYLNPDRFLSSRRKLDVESSRAAIEATAAGIGRPPAEAALAIVSAAESTIAEAIRAEMEAGGVQGHDIPLFGIGGAAGTRCCGVAGRLGLSRILALRLGAVYGAVGCAVTYLDGSQPSPLSDREGSNPIAALKGARWVYWPGGPLDTSIYERDLLRSGDQVSGPAIVEAPETTWLVPRSWKYTTDRHLNGILERA